MVRLDPDKEFMIVSGDRRHRSDLATGTFLLTERGEPLLEGSTRLRTSGDPEYPTPGDRLTLAIDMQDPEGGRTVLDTTVELLPDEPLPCLYRVASGGADLPFQLETVIDMCNGTIRGPTSIASNVRGIGQPLDMVTAGLAAGSIARQHDDTPRRPDMVDRLCMAVGWATGVVCDDCTRGVCGKIHFAACVELTKIWINDCRDRVGTGAGGIG